MDTAKAAGEMENLLLTDLIDIETLRRIQDSFPMWQGSPL